MRERQRNDQGAESMAGSGLCGETVGRQAVEMRAGDMCYRPARQCFALVLLSLRSSEARWFIPVLPSLRSGEVQCFVLACAVRSPEAEAETSHAGKEQRYGAGCSCGEEPRYGIDGHMSTIGLRFRVGMAWLQFAGNGNGN